MSKPRPVRLGPPARVLLVVGPVLMLVFFPVVVGLFALFWIYDRVSATHRGVGELRAVRVRGGAGRVEPV